MVGSRSRIGLTLIQLVWLIAVTGLLAAFLFPIIHSAREYECRPSCLSQLKQLGLAMMMYTQDYDECLPSSRPDPNYDWSITLRNTDDQSVERLHNSSPWIAQLFPYAKSQSLFRCPSDSKPERNHTSMSTGDSATSFPVSYGPNLMFVNPSEYGRKKPVVMSSVDEPGAKYLLGDCMTAFGFDMDTIAYLRYPNYDPALHQNGWSLDQFTAAGRVARPEREAEGLTRHQSGSNIVFADGRAKWLRHDQIPNNDGPNGGQYRELQRHVVPWKPGERAGG